MRPPVLPRTFYVWRKDGSGQQVEADFVKNDKGLLLFLSKDISGGWRVNLGVHESQVLQFAEVTP